MSIIKDLFDLKKAICDDNGINFSFKRNSSITREANKGVLQFPVLVSNSLSIEEASMISKALERNFVSFVSILTSIDSVTDEKSIEDYLSRLHQNIGKDSVDNRDLNSLTSLFKESTVNFNESKFNYESSIRNSTLHKKFNKIHQLNEFAIENLDENYEFETFKNLNYETAEKVATFLSESLNIEPKNIYYMKSSNSIFCLKENKVFEILNYDKDDAGKPCVISSPLFNLDNVKLTNISESIDLEDFINEFDDYEDDFEEEILNERTMTNNYIIVSSDKKLENKYNKYGDNLSEARSLPVDLYKTEFEDDINVVNHTKNLKTLVDNDVKKCNEMVPTLLTIKTYFKNKEGTLQAVDYIIGVKTIIHSLPSESIIENCTRGVKRNRTFFNFLKWTSGEITFFKDFLFAIKDIKLDVKGKFKDSHWWEALRQRKKYSKAMNLTMTKNQAVPNSSLVITMEEANILKNEYSIDVTNPNIVRQLIKEYFLLSFSILDSSLEIANVMFDGETNFQQFSYTSLERENSNQAREVKNIMQILGKM